MAMSTEMFPRGVQTQPRETSTTDGVMARRLNRAWATLRKYGAPIAGGLVALFAMQADQTPLSAQEVQKFLNEQKPQVSAAYAAPEQNQDIDMPAPTDLGVSMEVVIDGQPVAIVIGDVVEVKQPGHEADPNAPTIQATVDSFKGVAQNGDPNAPQMAVIVIEYQGRHGQEFTGVAPAEIIRVIR